MTRKRQTHESSHRVLPKQQGAWCTSGLHQWPVFQSKTALLFVRKYSSWKGEMRRAVPSVKLETLFPENWIQGALRRSEKEGEELSCRWSTGRMVRSSLLGNRDICYNMKCWFQWAMCGHHLGWVRRVIAPEERRGTDHVGSFCSKCLPVTVFESHPARPGLCSLTRVVEGWAGRSLTGFIHRRERKRREELKPASFI